MNPKYSRRSFLRATGLSAAALPLLHPRASAAAGPKRVVIVSWSNGVWREDFWPTGTETEFSLPKILTPLEPFKKEMLVLAGLDVRAFYEARGANYRAMPRVGDAHKVFPALLTGAHFAQYAPDMPYPTTAGGPSIDQYIAEQLATRGMTTPFKSLVLGGRTGSGWGSCISYSGHDSPGITPENDPRRLFNTLFQGRSLPGGGFDKLSAQRKSVLDFVAPEVDRFSKNLGTDDRKKIAAHLQTVRELERQLATGSTVACAKPNAPTIDFKQNDAYPALLDAQFGLIATALKCDLTRVVTFMMESTGGNDIVFSWLGPEFVGKGDDYPTRQHHDIAHADYRGPEYVARYSRCNQWFMEKVAGFLKLLKETPEGTGTMLDNTAVLIMNGMGVNHNADGVGAVLVGGCGGYFKTGRLLRFGQWATKKRPEWKYYWGSPPTGINSIGTSPQDLDGLPHNGILVALANAMGIETKTFGDPQYGGELPGLRG
jgi:hypothetical protein